VKTWLMIAMLFLVTGCAAARSGDAGVPTRSDLRPFAGQWTGTIMGRDMASAQGLIEDPARLTLTDDGHWTLTSNKGTAASGVARRTAQGIVLQGRMTGGDPMQVGRDVSYVLKPRGTAALYGEGQHFYLGRRIDDEILLRRQAA
jgi:hypothetical protein